jgi:biotin carboxylase
MKKILVIGAGWEQLALIETIVNAGHYVIATHPSINADGFKIANQYYVRDSRDIEGHLQIAETHNVDAVITDNCDYSFYTASIICSKLKLPFADILAAQNSNDKFGQRMAVQKSNAKQPVFAKVRTIDDLKKAMKSIGFPSVIKPVDSRGTFGVTIIHNESELIDAYYQAIANSPSRVLIFEQFIKGTLVTVDGFCFSNGHRSLTVASRKFEEGAKPVTKEIIYPAMFDDEVNKELMKNHHEVVKSLNLNYGHTHGEYILTESNDIYLVECANRGGGVYTSSVIVPLLTEIDLNEILLNQSLGIDNYKAEDLSTQFMKHSIMLTFLDFQTNKVIESINTEEMQNLDYVVRFRSIYGENDMVESIENCAGRHSMLVLKGANVEEVLVNFDSFKKDFKIIYH